MGLLRPDVKESWDCFVLSVGMVEGVFKTETGDESRVDGGFISDFWVGIGLGTGG